MEQENYMAVAEEWPSPTTMSEDLAQSPRLHLL